MRLRDVRLMFEVRDLWCGVFWDRGWIGSTVDRAGGRCLTIYVCLVPCFPIRVTLSR